MFAVFIHGNPTESIIIETDLAAPTGLNIASWWGIREFQVHLAKCDVECAKCDGPENTDCTDCYGLMELRDGSCHCKIGSYKVKILPCLTDLCVECKPCPDACK